jgi:WD40 repeat protein
VGEQRLVTGGGDGTVRLWRANDGKLISTIVLAEPFPIEMEDEADKEGDGAAPAGAGSGGASVGGAGSVGVVSGEEPR